MTPWQAAILGLVEGVAEYLPISSTGHLILAGDLLRLDIRGPAVQAFMIVVQGGAILAVLVLYRSRVAQMIAGVLGRDPAGRRLVINLAVAFAPAAALGPLLDDFIDTNLFAVWPVVGALAAGGVIMILIGPWQRRHPRPAVELEQLTWRGALVIGAFQCLAMWPGTSRSMVTIVAAMLVGMPPRRAAEFSFLLGLPTLGGACAYKLVQNVTAGGGSLFTDVGWLPLLVGFAVATVSAALAVEWLVAWLNKHGLAMFGWYRLVLAGVYLSLAIRSL